MIAPHRAPVRPRVISIDTRQTLLLDDVVATLVDHPSGGIIELVGGPGSGKTTALAHLASLGFEEKLTVVDDARPQQLPGDAANRVLVYTTRRPMRGDRLRYALAPWSTDDLIEYLLAKYPAACASVMSRFTADEQRFGLAGMPTLYCHVADQMAMDLGIRNVSEALRHAVEYYAGDELNLADARFVATGLLLGQVDLATARANTMIDRGVSPVLMRLVGCPLIQVLLAADRILSSLRAHKPTTRMALPKVVLPGELIDELARTVRSDTTAQERLEYVVERKKPSYFVPMAASILVGADSTWRPRPGSNRDFRTAHLAGAQWQRIELKNATLDSVNLDRADLSQADLSAARLAGGSLRSCVLQDASLVSVRANDADFSSADLSRATATRAKFQRANLSDALLQSARAEQAVFRFADLRRARLDGASLVSCDFYQARLEEASFVGANLQHANLCQQALKTVNLQDADLTAARLEGCDVEYIAWPDALLENAQLRGAWLSGSLMPRAKLRFADLHGAHLADIEWERADLRHADLRECTFHFGSTRSGLVGSPYPSHGTRTGFYTNDYDEQSFKGPEEIRKANLVGADLRGAKIDGVDFYLVDLRGARYTLEQERHFRRCDAILHDVER